MQLKKPVSNTPPSPVVPSRINLTASPISEVMEIGVELALCREYVSYLRDIIAMLREVQTMQSRVVG